MNKLGTAIGCLLLLGAAVTPGVFAHGDTGQHLPPWATTGLDVLHGEFDGDSGPCPAVDPAPADGGSCYYGDNDNGRHTVENAAFRAGVGGKPSGWYYGSVSAYLELQAVSHGTVPLPDPVGTIDLNPGFLFAAAFALCDMEVLGDGTAHAPEDETFVDGLPAGTAPDGTFNDGGIGAACHTPASFYSHADYNTPGCSYSNAQAIDLLTGEDVWISTSCDWLTPAVEAGLLDHLLTLTTCIPNSVFDGSAPAGTLDCVNQFVACAITGVGCPSAGASFCGADGGGDAGETGNGDAGGAGGELPTSLPVNGVPYPAGPFTDSDGNVCTDISAAVFVWNAAVADVEADINDPTFEALGPATYGFIY